MAPPAHVPPGGPMADDSLHVLLPALGIAAFTRTRDGTFSSVAPVPPWFARLLGDATFPFLGHVLEEANRFWQANTPGSRDWGPAADVDESGREFHYCVTAVTTEGAQFLVFQLDPGTDRLRDTLQAVRQRALAQESSTSDAQRLSAARDEVRRARGEIVDVLRRVLRDRPTDLQRELLESVAERCDTLLSRVDAIATGR